VRADGTRGNYLDKFARVFRRDGEACLTCGTTILKTRVAGRGTHYCPKCQPEQ
jgi:formamidopyrimidine-DNA glycosylase